VDGLTWLLGAKLPYPAGLLLSGALAAFGCAVWLVAVAAFDRERGDGIQLAMGGFIVAGFLAVLGLLLLALGAPAFD
jgi:hypothetical protein